jgi:hypothetical protein
MRCFRSPVAVDNVLYQEVLTDTSALCEQSGKWKRSILSLTARVLTAMHAVLWPTIFKSIDGSHSSAVFPFSSYTTPPLICHVIRYSQGFSDGLEARHVSRPPTPLSLMYTIAER